MIFIFIMHFCVIRMQHHWLWDKNFQDMHNKSNMDCKEWRQPCHQYTDWLKEELPSEPDWTQRRVNKCLSHSFVLIIFFFPFHAFYRIWFKGCSWDCTHFRSSIRHSSKQVRGSCSSRFFGWGSWSIEHFGCFIDEDCKWYSFVGFRTTMWIGRIDVARLD